MWLEQEVTQRFLREILNLRQDLLLSAMRLNKQSQAHEITEKLNNAQAITNIYDYATRGPEQWGDSAGNNNGQQPVGKHPRQSANYGLGGSIITNS